MAAWLDDLVFESCRDLVASAPVRGADGGPATGEANPPGLPGGTVYAMMRAHRAWAARFYPGLLATDRRAT